MIIKLRTEKQINTTLHGSKLEKLFNSSRNGYKAFKSLEEKKGRFVTMEELQNIGNCLYTRITRLITVKLDKSKCYSYLDNEQLSKLSYEKDFLKILDNIVHIDKHGYITNLSRMLDSVNIISANVFEYKPITEINDKIVVMSNIVNKFIKPLTGHKGQAKRDFDPNEILQISNDLTYNCQLGYLNNLPSLLNNYDREVSVMMMDVLLGVNRYSHKRILLSRFKNEEELNEIVDKLIRYSKVVRVYQKFNFDNKNWLMLSWKN